MNLFNSEILSDNSIKFNKNKKQVTEKNEPANDTSIQKLNKDSIKSIELNQNIKIEDASKLLLIKKLPILPQETR